MIFEGRNDKSFCIFQFEGWVWKTTLAVNFAAYCIDFFSIVGVLLSDRLDAAGGMFYFLIFGIVFGGSYTLFG
jgi:hypothetical protein